MFTITQRQYEIIIRQAIENLPRESGGFLGGKDEMISGVLPVYNQAITNATAEFSITSEDIERAYRFFTKHNLQYYGVYHSHPNGVAEPSIQDMRNNQRFLFIIGLSNPTDPILAAYEAHGLQAERIPIKVIDNNKVTVLDLQPNQQKQSQSPMVDEAVRLESFYQDIINEKIRYQKLNPTTPNDSSQFSTYA